MTVGWGGLDRTILALAASQLPVVVRFSMAPLSLARPQIETLARCLSWLNGGTPKSLTYSADQGHADAHPAAVIASHLADPLWLSLVVGSSAGRDLRLSKERIGASARFVNKLWNVAKLVERLLGDAVPSLPEVITHLEYGLSTRSTGYQGSGICDACCWKMAERGEFL